MTNLPTDARGIWRIVRLTARHYDRTWPFWWKDPRAIAAVSRPESDTATRCWALALRNRTGE